MVGAMILARVSDDPALSDEALAETRAWIASRGDSHARRKPRAGAKLERAAGA